jgi:hypothetical protein
MSRPTHDQVRTELRSFGGIQVDDFSMAEPERKRKEATDGYCEGIALDWIRRVLQGGRLWLNATRLRGDNPDHLYLQKAQSQAARQALAYMEWVPTVNQWEAKYDVARERAERNFNQGMTEKAARLQSLHKKLYELLTSNPNSRVELTPLLMDLIGEFFGNSVGRVMDRNKLEELFETNIPQMKREMEAPPRFDPTGVKAKYLHDGMRKHAWTEFSTTLDTGSRKKRSFSNISLLSAEPTLILDINGVADKLKLIGANDLQEQRAVKINLGGTQGKKEFFHSTASYLKPAFKTPYLFLDPNYGVFAYSQWLQVAKAILYLYTKVYSWTQAPPAHVPFQNYRMQIDVFGPAR